MHLSQIQQDVQAFSKAKGFDHSTIEQRALFLVTEVGEVVQELLHISYHPDADNLDEIKARLGLEMYDVIWNLADLVNKLGIDLEEATRQKMAINADRVWKD